MRTIGIALVLLSGCAGRQVKLGDSLAAQGNWIAAYDAYDSALRDHPGSGRAAEGRAMAAPYAAAQLCERASAYLGSGDPESSWRDLTRADRVYPSNSCVDAVEDRLVEAELERAMQHLSVGEVEAGYRLIWTVYGRYPERPQPLEALVMVRELTMNAADKARDDGKPHVALYILSLNPAIEGEELPQVAALRSEVTYAWVVDLRGKVTADRSQGRPASAYLHAHMAAALSGEAKDREIAQSAREALHRTLDLPVALRVDAPSPRPERFSAALRQELQAPGLSWATRGSEGLVVDVRLGPRSCENSATAATELVQYEVIESVPNEQWHTLAQQATAQREQRDQLGEELTYLRGQRAGLAQAFEASGQAEERAALEARVSAIDADIAARSQAQIEASDRIVQLEGQLETTPRFVDVAVPREAPLLVEEHRRVCSSSMRMLLNGAGLDELPYAAERSVEVRDRVHGPLPVAGLPADPLAFPRGDNELGRELDLALAADAAAQVEAALGRLRNQALRGARESEDAEDVARAWLRAWWLSEAVPEGMVEALHPHFPGLQAAWLLP